MSLYFAYGSNLHLEQMKRRCPAAEALGRIKLDHWRLVFRGVADCIPEHGATCWGGVWRITKDCEMALDVYEGVRGGLYRKEYIPIKRTPQGEISMLIYVMNSTGVMPPSVSYYNVIKQGYRDFRMPPIAHKALAQTLRASWDDKAPSHLERQRYRRTGRPHLAPRPGKPDMPATGDIITLAN